MEISIEEMESRITMADLMTLVNAQLGLWGDKIPGDSALVRMEDAIGCIRVSLERVMQSGMLSVNPTPTDISRAIAVDIYPDDLASREKIFSKLNANAREAERAASSPPVGEGRFTGRDTGAGGAGRSV